MADALAGFVDVEEVVFSVYFVNREAAIFNLKRSEDIELKGERYLVVNVSDRDRGLIDREQVCYTRTQRVTRRRKAPIPGERDTPPSQTSAPPDTSSDA